MKINLINNQDQDYANKKLAHYYENGLIPAEKKAYLTELNNNLGPYMGVESEGGKTHYLMDAASQIATLGLGFSPSVFMGVAHHQSAWTNNPTDPEFLKIKNSLHSFLMRKANWNHLDLTLCNSGAESNEIALGYAYRRRLHKEAKKVLAFEGSFHGRMLISLFSTWNPSKREPFQRKGYETVFNNYPELPDANIQRDFPTDWRSLWDNSARTQFSTPKEWEKDELLALEVKCLLEVKEKIAKKDIFAIIIEPMQCEGGDRYASDRFHTALLLMARSYGVSVIHDEVQTGFHLGREFFWHRQFDLKDVDGAQLNPDFVVCAKKAQVGMILSPHDLKRTTLEQREQFQVPSAIRGYFHGLALDQAREKILECEQYVSKKLDQLLKGFEGKLSRPRVMGLSFAFDVDTTDNVASYIAKRFNHGLLYYPAGSHTLRFRLNTSYTFADIDFLFERLEEISQEIYEGKESTFNSEVETKARNLTQITNWQNFILAQRLNPKTLNEEKVLNSWQDFLKSSLPSDKQDKISLIVINKDNFDSLKEEIDDIQKAIYEPTRQTSLERFKVCAESSFGINIALLEEGKIVAMAFASSLKDHPLERGIRQDRDFENPKCLYMIDTTVRKNFQSFGFGRLLKYTLTSIALARGYESIKGRNRDKLAAGMLNINLSLGSFEQMHLREDYPDFEKYRDVIYYESPLHWPKESGQLGNRLNGHLALSEIDESFAKEQLPYLTNKVCLSNFVSEKFLSHVKSILEVFPQDIQHGYTASGQSECVDKIFKSLIYNEKEKFDNEKPMLTFEGHYFGQGSFLSRSLSHGETDPYFPVKKLSQPTKENSATLLKELEENLSQNKVSSVWLEPVTQLSYEHIDQSILEKIHGLCEKYDIPLIFNETASQQFTFSDDHYFASNLFTPSAAMAFLGGQAGIVALKEKHFVAKPLMMISTWDGDEHAFASYHRAMDHIIKGKSDFLNTRESFERKWNEILSAYGQIEFNLIAGRGLIKGALPATLSQSLRKTPEGHILDASYFQMKD